MLKLIVNNEHPEYVQILEDIIKKAKNGEIRGLAVAFLIDDIIHTDFATSHGTGFAELNGCLDLIRHELIERMKK